MHKKRHDGLYHSLVVLPDRLYPFQTEVAGQWVRGVRSYNATLAQYQKRYGAGHYGYKLNAYRQLFHITGSILFLVSAAYLSQSFFGSTIALYAFLIAAVLFISFQEFYLQRRTYRQLWRKGVVDWLAWCAPIGAYLLTHFH
ncbi:MAG: hypothetical protein WC217_01010 [Candidatus Paceibacterota bacterium]|jgi:hypothetical protein